MGTCGLSNGEKKTRISDKPYAFVLIPYKSRYYDTWMTIENTVQGRRIKRKKVKVKCAAKERKLGGGFCKICQLIWFSDFGIAELGDLNQNVFLEIGLMWGFRKPIIFTINREFTKIKDVPFDLKNFMFIPYSNSKELRENLQDKIKYLILLLKQKS